MDNAFKKSENETASLQVTGLKRPSPGNKSDRKQTGAISTKPETRKRVKLNESLQEEGGMTKGNTDELDGKPLRHQRDTPDADGHGGGVKTRRNAGSDIPGRLRLQDSSISPFFESPETRSKVRKQAVTTMRFEKIRCLILTTHSLNISAAATKNMHLRQGSTYRFRSGLSK